MKNSNIIKATSIAIGSVILGTSQALALGNGFPDIPEPSSLSVYAIAIAGLVIAYRLRNRK